MRGLGLSLTVTDVRDDLSRFHLLHYAPRVDGFLISGHNSGTHWLRFMLSAAIASHLSLPEPAYSSGPGSDDFIGHPRHDRRFQQAPRIGSSHHMPSRLVAALAACGALRLPPVVVLVRNIPDALLSYFFKWRDAKGLGALADYLGRQPSPKGVDAWWFIRFFNRWSALRRALPDRVLVVRYEDLQNDPGPWIRRIWAHWGVALSDADVTAALAVQSREALAARLDPAYGEDIAPERSARQSLKLDWDEATLLGQHMVEHLKDDFGYAAMVRGRRMALQSVRSSSDSRR